nr:YncE family protein [Bacteroidota bacterium]
MKELISNRIFVLLLIALVVSACKKDNNFGEVNTNTSAYNQANGVFVVNEGNFGNANGSLSFLNTDSLKMENDIFQHANSRPLGDVPLSMTIIGGHAWIVVNNSAKIEICKLDDMKSAGAIGGLTSPRFMLPVSATKAYVSDFYAGNLTIINTESQSITGEISLGHSSEQMIFSAGKVFVAFWSNYNFPEIENKLITVIDPGTDSIVGQFTVGKEPNSMVSDKDGKLWILCSGGFSGEELPSLWRLNPVTLQTETVFYFETNDMSPNNLCINGTGDTLYFLNQGIFSIPANATQLPTNPLIPEGGNLFYMLAVDPNTSVIYASDAIDYQQRGLILRYRPDGTLIDSYRAGVIPGRMGFIVK